jgi:hypothetical protein
MSSAASAAAPVPLAAPLARARRLLAAGIIALLVVHHGAVIALIGTSTIGGERRYLVDDDVMISMRYARNLAEGVGLVYNPGERVEGFSNPLLTFIAAGLHRLPLSLNTIPLAVQLMNLLVSVGIVLLLLRAPAEPRDRWLVGLPAALLYTLNPQHIVYAQAGYEVYLQAVLFLFGVLYYDRMGILGALLLGLLPLTHATSTVAFGVLVGAVLVFHRAPLGRRLLLAVVATLPAAAYELFRIVYYHALIPNTFWLKAGSGTLLGGPKYVVSWLRLVAPVAALSCVPFARALARFPAAARKVLGGGGADWQERNPVEAFGLVCVVLVAAHVLAVVAVGGDYFPMSRFLFPCTLVLTLLAERALVALVRRVAPQQSWLRGTAAAAVFAVVLGWTALRYKKEALAFEDHRQWNTRHAAFGEAIRLNTKPGQVIALFAVGHACYYGERPCIDMLGKVDAHISRLRPRPQRALAHNKADFDYVMGRDPDFVELNIAPPGLADIAQLQDTSLNGAHGYQAELALNPKFRADYAAHPVTDPTGRVIRLYAREGQGAVKWTIAPEYFAEVPDS